MKIAFNAISNFVAQKSYLPDRRKMSETNNTAMSNTAMSLVSLRNSQMKGTVDKVSFSGSSKK